MSEISETEIKAMTKEQNYIRGYKDGKSDVLDKIKDDIENYKLSSDELSDADEDSVKWGMKIAYDIVDKYTRQAPTVAEGSEG